MIIMAEAQKRGIVKGVVDGLWRHGVGKKVITNQTPT